MTLTALKTAHHEKENIVPIKIRVKFAEADIATYVPSPRTISNTARSILKRTTSTPISKETENIKPARVLMDDPLQCPTYFEGPVNTLIASIPVRSGFGITSAHDIAEAYDVFSARVREQAEHLKKTDTKYPALEAIRCRKDNAPMLLLSALQRHIWAAHNSPLSANQPSTSNGVRRGMTEEEAKRAIDTSCVCHAALRFLANVFALPGLQAVFYYSNDTILDNLMAAVLRIASEDALPSLNPVKTYALTISILNTQKLPKRVLKKHASKIAVVIQNSIRGKMGKKESLGPHFAGVRAIKVLLDEHPEIFLPHFQDILPSLYVFLINASLETRLLASKTVLAFAHAISYSRVPLDLQQEYSKEIANIIDRDIMRSKKAESKHLTLQDVFKISRSSKTYEADVAFSLITIASFIVISGPFLFTRPRSLKFLFKQIGDAKKLQRTLVGQLLFSVWKCFIWSSTKLSDWGVTESHPHIEEQTYKILRQEGDYDLSTALIGSLLSARANAEARRANVIKALEIVKATIESFDNRTSGVQLVHALISGAVTQSRWNNKLLIPEDLFWDRILDSESIYIVDTVKALPKIDPSSIPVLSEQEIEEHWQAMLALWKDAVNARLRAAIMQLEPNLLEVWRTLLMSHSRIMSRPESSTLSTTAHHHIIDAYNFVLRTPQEGNPSVEEKQSLKAVHQMWRVMQDIVDKAALSVMAPTILEYLISLQYKLVDSETKELWLLTCRELLFVNVQGALAVWSERTSRVQDEKLKQQIWVVFVKSVLDLPRTATSMPDLIFALLFPIDWLRLNEKQYRSWDRLLQLAIAQAQRDRVSVHDIIDPIGGKLLQCAFGWKLKVPIIILVLLIQRILHHGFDEFKHWKAVSAAATCLQQCYPPEESLTPGFKDFLKIYRQLVQSCHSEDNLRTLSKGLLPWVEDKESALSDEHYNEQIVPMYCDFVKNARLLTPTKLVFCDADFLAFITSVFSRPSIPAPAEGVIAFQNFWEDLSPLLHFEEDECPVRLAQCVKSLVETFGGDLPTYLQSESQSESLMSMQSDIDSLAMPITSFDRQTPGERTTFDMVVPETPLEMQGMRQPLAMQETTSPIECNRDFVAAQQATTITESPTLSPPAYRQKRRKVHRSHSQQPETSPERPSASTVVHHLDQANSAPPSSNVLFDAVEVTPLQSVDRQRYTRFSAPGTAGQHDPSSSPHFSIARPAHPHSSDHDYSMWDTGLSSQHVRELIGRESPMLVEDVPAACPTSSPELQDSELPLWNSTVPLADVGHTATDANSRVGRSQTAPAALEAHSGIENVLSPSIATSSAEMRANALRRSRTTALETLHQLHHAMSNDVLMMQTQDLAEAAQMVHEIQGLFQAQISRKLESKRSKSPPDLFN